MANDLRLPPLPEDEMQRPRRVLSSGLSASWIVLPNEVAMFQVAMLDCLRVKGALTPSTGSRATPVKQLVNSHRRRTASKDILKDEKWYKQGCLAVIFDLRGYGSWFSPRQVQTLVTLCNPALVALWDEWPVGITFQ